jgi:hypothetical protein
MRRCLFVVLLALAACGQRDRRDATCQDVGTRFLELVRQQVGEAARGGLDDTTRAQIETHAPAMRDAMVRACEDGAWADETRACFARARSDTAMTACYESMPAEQRALLEKASAYPSR